MKLPIQFTEADAGYYIPHLAGCEGETDAITIADRNGAYEAHPIPNRFEVYFYNALVHVAPCLEFAEAWAMDRYESIIRAEIERLSTVTSR